MKTRLAKIALVTVAAQIACMAHGGLVAYDGFGNGPKANLAGSTGGTGWTNAWTSYGDNLTKIAGAGLTYPGLDSTPGGAVTPTAGGTWPNSQYARSYALPQGTTAIYVSFLMRDDAGYGMWGGTSFGTYPYEVTVGSPLGYYSYGLMLSEGLGDVSNYPLVTGETTLVVVKISKNAGSGITYRLFVNPTVGQAEPGGPAAVLSVNAVQTLPTTLSIDNGTGFTTDEIRVGTTWSSVLPAEPVCVGDLNNSGSVDGADVSTLLGAWGLPAGDLNSDGTTDPADLGILLGAWGACP